MCPPFAMLGTSFEAESLNIRRRQDIVVIHEISNCPKKSRSNNLRTSFDAQFHTPFLPCRIAHVELWIRSGTIL